MGGSFWAISMLARGASVPEDFVSSEFVACVVDFLRLGVIDFRTELLRRNAADATDSVASSPTLSSPALAHSFDLVVVASDAERLKRPAAVPENSRTKRLINEPVVLIAPAAADVFDVTETVSSDAVAFDVTVDVVDVPDVVDGDVTVPSLRCLAKTREQPKLPLEFLKKLRKPLLYQPLKLL